ncbi:MAG: cupin-like domain-containing protein, partial [Flavobacteriales bacterium]
METIQHFHIDRYSDLSRQQLLSKYVNKNRPVILTDTAKRWPAVGKWTPEFFKTRYGKISKEVNGRVVPLSEQIDLIKCSTPQNPAPYPYNLEVADYFPELMADMQPQLVFGKMDRGVSALMPKILMHGTPIHEIFFGGNGSWFPFIHYDALFLHTQITQIHGEKEFVLFHPDDSPYLYPSPVNEKWSQVNNVFDPYLEKFPLFAKATPYRETLCEGETLFFPSGWWHTTIT